ncbi:MAG: glycosyltransferase [Gammaproteobacteria bacterium]|nr:glycosyltransferase [Gammaproteobacteria bacterium]
MYRYPDAVILVFCKAPVPGQVKTRLTPPLTGEEAAQLHKELSELTLMKATHNALCPVQLWCAPDIGHPYFVSLEQCYAIERRQQQGDDLGARMNHAFAEALTHYKSAVLIGCDCPSFTSDDLEQALVNLRQGKTCVLAPAEDGGYVLIGLNRQLPFLFEDIVWGTEQVLAQSLMRLQAQKINGRIEKPTYVKIAYLHSR